MIKKSLIGRIVGIVLVAISTVSVTVGTLAWFRGAGGETENHIDGEIGLRGYFYDGNGSSKPFEIVDPIHLYNLCRLQNLGLISPGTEFQIGHNKGTVQNPDYKVHDNTSQDGWGYTLDMNGTPITPIGNEATPFESIIKGHGITIKNLDVKGNPEDIGFFGYVGCNGNVSGIILQDIDIYSLGYSSVETEKIYKMFNPNIDPTISTQVDTIFSDSAPYFERFTNVSFVNLSKTPVEESLLTQKNGLPSSAIATEINDVDNYLSPTAAPNNGKKIFNGYFKIVKPSDYLEDASLASQLSLEDKSKIQNDPFKYSYRVSSSLIDEFELVDINDDGSADKALMIDLTKLISAGTASNEFNAPGKNMQVKMRLAIYATFEEKGYKYSRVIQSYSIIFYSNNDKSYYYCSDCDKHYLGSSLVDGKCPEDASHTVSTTPATLYHCTDCDSNYVPTNNSTACPENASHSSSKISPQGYSVSMFCDYVAAADPEHKVTNYHHGNNIGYIAGHVDGTMSYCYVYGSQPHYYCDSCDKSYELGDLVNGHHCPIHTSKTLTQVNNDRYGCNFYLNNTPAGTTPENSKIKTESDIGLIGEVGTSVINTLDPQYGTSGVLNTGVMDFTKIYYGIRSDFATGESANVGHIAVPEANYISYGGENNTGKLNDSDASMFSDYEQYLRYVIINGKKQYISNAGYNVGGNSWHSANVGNINNYPEINSVDFLWNQVISKNDNNHNGLGVFKIATVHVDDNPNPSVTQDMVKSLGGSAIINGDHKTKVYFSTAEYDHTSEGTNDTGTAWASGAPFRANTLPTYSDENSFNYQFSRDYNYVFELDLSQSKDLAGYNYMAKTDSEFLKNYLSTKLISDSGDKISWDTKEFGFNFNIVKGTNVESLQYLSAYMPIGYPKDNAKSRYGVEAIAGSELDDELNPSTTGYYYENETLTTLTTDTVPNDSKTYYAPICYPSDSITFSITTLSGANVSVVGNGADITIYKHNPNKSAANDIIPMYTMRSTNVNGENDYDVHRYFEYTVKKDTVEEVNEIIGADLDDNLNLAEAGIYFEDEELTIPTTDTSPDDTKTYYTAKKVTTKYGITAEKSTVFGNSMKDDDALYAHIFKLPPGDYVIGSSASGKTANVYYLAVQGQESADYGTAATVEESNFVDYVDFLTAPPTKSAFDNGTLAYAEFNFSIEFNKSINKFTVSTKTDNSKRYLSLEYNESPLFVEYLSFVCKSSSPKYYIQGNEYKKTSYVYKSH